MGSRGQQGQTGTDSLLSPAPGSLLSLDSYLRHSSFTLPFGRGGLMRSDIFNYGIGWLEGGIGIEGEVK